MQTAATPATQHPNGIARTVRSRTDRLVHNVMLGDRLVGAITRQPDGGYRVSMFRREFVNAPYTVICDPIARRRLSDALDEAQYRIDGLTLKPQQ